MIGICDREYLHSHASLNSEWFTKGVVVVNIDKLKRWIKFHAARVVFP